MDRRMPRAWSLLRRPIGRAAAVVVLANALFLLLMLAAQRDRCAALSRVRSAFESGDLTTRDFLWRDARRGWFQFDDCNALQMLVNEDSPRLRRALAPIVYQENEDWEGQCRVLRFLVEEWVDPAALTPMRYSRYWHGYNVVGAFALPRMQLRHLRRLLSAAVWISIGALALAAWRSGLRVRRTGLSIAVAAATIWAVPYFAPGLSQGPGDAFLMLALAGIALCPKMAADLGRIVPYAAGFGAAVVFLEMLTGKIPTAVAWLAALTLAAARDEERPGGLAPRAAALAAVTAFLVAAAATVAAKLILAGLLAERAAPASFAARLDHYFAVPNYWDYSARWVPRSLANLPGLLLPFARLLVESRMLAYGSSRAGYLLVAAVGVACIAAVVRAWRARRTEGGRDMAVLVAAAIIPGVWVLLLPLHAYIHAPFMVRMLVVPASLAPLVLAWPRKARTGAVSEGT
jgi:hypothetical protein